MSTSGWLKVVWAPLAVVVLHGALSALFGHDRGLDPFFHFLGGMAGALALAQVFEVWPRLAARVAIKSPAIRIILLMAGVALLWELVEFLSDRVAGTHIQRGPADTWLDVALGIAGAVVIAAAMTWRQARK